MQGSHETTDELRTYGLRVIQPRHGYRFSLDPLLLCAFAEPDAGGRIADLGTGCGIIPLILARKDEQARVVGVEQQEGLAALAGSNVCLNGLGGRVTILRCDVIELRALFPTSSFDAVVANPPYRRRGTGKVSPKAGRDNARHESTAGLADFLDAAKYLVRPGGRICFIYHPSRLVELLASAASLKLAPLRLRMVHGNREAPARMFMVELAKGRKGELNVLPPLFVYDGDGEYSEEVRMILGEKGA